jgi:hypothetical protein
VRSPLSALALRRDHKRGQDFEAAVVVAAAGAHGCAAHGEHRREKKNAQTIQQDSNFVSFTARAPGARRGAAHDSGARRPRLLECARARAEDARAHRAAAVDCEFVDCPIELRARPLGMGVGGEVLKVPPHQHVARLFGLVGSLDQLLGIETEAPGNRAADVRLRAVIWRRVISSRSCRK